MSSDDSGIDRRTVLKFAGGAGAMALAGCSGGGGDGGGDGGGGDGGDGGDGGGTPTGDGGDVPDDFAVTITQGQMPSTLDPQNHRSTPTDNVVLHAYEGLLSRSAEGTITDGLATNFERVEPGRVKFTLREGVTFHSGNDLTPQDVVFSIRRIVDSSVGIESPQRDQLAGVTDAQTVDGERAVEVLSEGEDGPTLNPIVFEEFATYCDIMEQAWVEENDGDYIAQNTNGTGPFQLSSYEPDVEVVFERFDDYWGGPAAISELTFRAAEESSTRVNQLVEGETDLVVNVPPQEVSRVRENDGTRIAAVPSTRLLFNGMRYDVEPFSSQKFRRAMNLAVDLNGIIENVLQTFGAPTGQPTLEGFTGYNPDVSPYAHDPDMAEQLVEESGFAGASLTLHTPVGRYLKDVEIAQAVASQISELENVSAEVMQREFTALAGELTDGNLETTPPFYLIGWGNATFDASQTIIPLLTTDGALSSFSNEQLDQTMQEAQTEANPEQRASLLQEANRIAHDQSPWIFLNRQFSVYGVSERLAWNARRDERIDAYDMQPSN